jgi:hypothetical protein
MTYIVLWTILEVVLICDRPDRCYNADLYQVKCNCKYQEVSKTLHSQEFETLEAADRFYTRAVAETVNYREGQNIREPRIVKIIK